MIHKLYRVQFAADPQIITIQPVYDVEKQIKNSDIFKNVQMQETNEELKMDLAGYVGDFHRHRVGTEIKKRIGFSEEELITMMVKDDKLKEIALAFREVDPDRNGFVTQQELDDIFRENYKEQMVGRHIFTVCKDFRSITNKILVDYNKFKGWLNSKLKERRRL